MGAEAVDGAEGLTNEAAALADILAWSADCPAWQRAALRRLCTQETLDTADTDALLAICKGVAQGVPLSTADIRDPAASTAIVSLGALHGLTDVNALAVGERLTFGKSGLTVIYGDNGAGKSGYARVLKQLCRARSPKGETILPNIYAANTGTPTANVDFQIGGQKRTVAWRQGNTVDAMLSAVSVFDSRTANVHVDSTNDLAYTPLPLRVLAALAQACQDIKTQLNKEIAALEAQTPAVIAHPECKLGTDVGKLVAALSAKTTPAQVEALAGLSAEQQTRFDTLQSDLGSDPAKIARQLQSAHGKLITAADRLHTLTSAVTDALWTQLRVAAQQLATARAAAAAASATLFSAEPLPDVGSDVWKELWEAARAYSRASAYPDSPFPVTDAGAHCVLCHQELDEAARRRLGSFEAFVLDESKRREEEAKERYDQALGGLAAARFSMTEMHDLLSLVRDEIGNITLADNLRRETVQACWRWRAIMCTHRHTTPPDLPQIPSIPFGELQTATDALTKRIELVQSEQTSPERLALVAERDGLADRAWLALVKEDVLAQIKRLIAIDGLNKAAKETSTNKITTQSAKVAQALVTNRLRGRFAKEVDKLGVAGLAIELQQAKTSAGVPHFQVRLINKPSEPVGKVLSEGEHRCVALAAFLAELATIEAPSAIVFDDPVSSLDHQHRDKVAARLADEGQNRQVIIFTHDMAFLLLLDEACRATKDRNATQISYRSVSRVGESAGFCHDDQPASVMPLDKVIEGMRTHLDNVKIQHERGDQANWQREITSFQDQLRTTWERAVEDFVAPVIRRLSRKVDTAGLLKLTVLTIADCESMRDAFGRCSKLLHSQPGELNPPIPVPAVIEAEIEALEKWIKGIRDRQGKLG